MPKRFEKPIELYRKLNNLRTTRKSDLGRGFKISFWYIDETWWADSLAKTITRHYKTRSLQST